MEKTIFLGLSIGLGAIFLGQWLEGSNVLSLFQGTAALIVFGGTLGAVLVAHSSKDIQMARSLLKMAFQKDEYFIPERVKAELIEASQIARKESILALEKRLSQFSHPFMREVFRSLIDGMEPETVRSVFENEIYQEQKKLLSGIKVYSDAGGFAPTIGIIGAVLGLIHVMENLTDTSKLGSGIAIAFVATIYGVGSANLVLIPLAQRLRRKVGLRSQLCQMMLDGALGITQGLNPFVLEQKLVSFQFEDTPFGIKKILGKVS